MLPAGPLRVRLKGDWLSARVVGEEAGTIQRTVSGRMMVPNPGDYLVFSGTALIDVVPAAKLAQYYEAQITDGVVIDPATRRLLDDRLGMGASRTGADLLQAVTRLARLKIGDVEIQLTAGQWEEIAYRAAKNQRTAAQELQLVIQRIEDELFHGGQGRSVAGRV